MEKKVVNIAGKQYVLRIGEFDEDFDVEEFLKIDYSNLVGELVTFPIIENRIGIMLADAESKVNETKLNRDILEANAGVKENVSAEEAINAYVKSIAKDDYTYYFEDNDIRDITKYVNTSGTAEKSG